MCLQSHSSKFRSNINSEFGNFLVLGPFVLGLNDHKAECLIPRTPIVEPNRRQWALWAHKHKGKGFYAGQFMLLKKTLTGVCNFKRRNFLFRLFSFAAYLHIIDRYILFIPCHFISGVFSRYSHPDSFSRCFSWTVRGRSPTFYWETNKLRQRYSVDFTHICGFIRCVLETDILFLLCSIAACIFFLTLLFVLLVLADNVAT